MVIYKQLHSILLKDGIKRLVDVNDWAKIQLSEAEYVQFVSDEENILEPFYRTLIESGDLILEPITETVPGLEIQPIIGRKYTHIGEDRTHEKFRYWQERFAADPAVTYHPLILQQ